MFKTNDDDDDVRGVLLFEKRPLPNLNWWLACTADWRPPYVIIILKNTVYLKQIFRLQRATPPRSHLQTHILAWNPQTVCTAVLSVCFGWLCKYAHFSKQLEAAYWEHHVITSGGYNPTPTHAYHWWWGREHGVAYFQSMCDIELSCSSVICSSFPNSTCFALQV